MRLPAALRPAPFVGGSPTGFAAGSIVALALANLVGCTGMIRGAMEDSAVEMVFPATLKSDDPGLSCQAGQGSIGMLAGFGEKTDEPYTALMLSYLSAGQCAEARGFEEEMLSMRAFHEKRAGAAIDHQITAQRFYADAARRFQAAFLRLDKAFPPRKGKTCPQIEPERRIIYMMGLSSGLMAVMNDGRSGAQVGVSLDIPAKVAELTQCLDNEALWGVPQALRAAIWSSVPPLMPDGTTKEDLYAMLAASSAMGETAGVRLARAFEVQNRFTDGPQARAAVMPLIQAHVASLETVPPNPKYRLLDATATAMITQISDRIWMECEGHRTPTRGLGTFPDCLTGDGGEDEEEGEEEE